MNLQFYETAKLASSVPDAFVLCTLCVELQFKFFNYM